MIERHTSLQAEHILPPARFDAERTALQAELRAHKQHRRVDVGPFASVFFESYFTMWWQVQEMLRVEGGGAEQLVDELEAYAPLVPSGRTLTATMMLQIEDPVRRHRELSRLGGIEHEVALVINGEAVKGEADDDLDRTNADGKASSVHFFVFSLSDAQAAGLKDGSAEVQLRISHPNYNHMAGLTADQIASLAEDLT